MTNDELGSRFVTHHSTFDIRHSSFVISRPHLRYGETPDKIPSFRASQKNFAKISSPPVCHVISLRCQQLALFASVNPARSLTQATFVQC
jgi:hypothetical protein